MVFIFPNFLWAKVDLVQVVEKLQYPWAMDFLPGNEALVTEKPGRLQKVNLETGKKTEAEIKKKHEEDDEGRPRRKRRRRRQ